MSTNAYKLIVLSIGLALAVLPAAARLSAQDVETLVRAEKSWTNRSNLTVKVNSNEVTIGTYREAGSQDRDMKIDSVMITRKIIEADPEVARVQVRFYDPVNRNNYQLVDVRQSDVVAFSQGLVNNETLLSGIDIKSVSGSPDVVEGEFQAERLAAKKEIDKLRAEGVGVSAFMQLFSKAEDLAKAKNSPELRATLDRLNAAFDSRAEFVKQQKEKLASKQAEQARAQRAMQLSSAAEKATKVQSTKPVWEPPPAEVDPVSGMERFGMPAPYPGMFLLDRIFIARKIYQLRKENVSVVNIMPIWIRLETEVRAKNEVAVKNDIEYLQKQLGMPPLTDEQRRSATVVRMNKF